MAKGRTAGRIETGLGLFGVVALGVTLAVIFQWNPWPAIQTWLEERKSSLSEPATAWAQRAAGQPDAAGVTDRAVVLFMGDLVESHARSDGSLLWRRDADWAALAGVVTAAGGGDTGSGRVLVSKVDGKGFEAVDPYTGDLRWSDPDAVGAWTFRDAVLAIDCTRPGCAIVNRSPLDGGQRWRVPLPGAIRALAGANAGLLDLRPGEATFAEAEAASPRPMPRYLGFLLDHRVQILDTTAGRRLREEEVPNDARTVVVGNRTVRTTATTRDGSCRYTATGRDAAGGGQVWQRQGYDLRTAGGAGCEPRRDPSGGGLAMIATRGDNRQVFLSAVDGQELAAAGPGERIEGTDGEYGLVRAADGNRLRAVDLSGGATAWTRVAAPKSRVGVTPYAVLVVDPATERLVGLDRATGQVKLDLATGAVVLGIHPDGLVLGRGRTFGWIPFTGVA